MVLYIQLGHSHRSVWQIARRLSLCFVVCWSLGLTTASVARAAEPTPAAKPEKVSKYEEKWHALYVADFRVGYERSATGTLLRDGSEVIVSDSEFAMDLSRFGQKVRMRVLVHSEETPEGDLLAFDFESLNPPSAPIRNSGRVVGAKLILSKETDGKVQQEEIAWDRSVKSPAYHDRQVRTNPIKPGETRTIKSFDPQFAKFNTITLQGGEIRNTPLLNGQSRRLQSVSVTQSLVPLLAITEYLDEQGEQLKSVIPLMSMTTYAVEKQQALEPLAGNEVDLAVTMLVRTNQFERSSEARRVTYGITIAGEDPSKILPAGSTQMIRPVGPNSVDLTVTAISPPEGTVKSADGPGEQYLSSNRYMQVEDKLVLQHAADAAGAEKDPWKAAQSMERWVAQNLKKKNFSTLLASAAEVARELSGDCTEHSVLLAAMCRSRGIPARIAVGLVYVPMLSSFAGHMWTEVHIRGVWVPLDATLGNGGVSADHIKFADSSFSDDDDTPPISCFVPMVGALGKMKIEVRDVKYAK
jgi:hypothetical protein